VTLDVETVKEQQRGNWDAISDGWEAFDDLFERAAQAVTARLLELAGVRSGQSVLDLGCGHGEPALSASEVVGPCGHVLGIDISPRMVAVARRRANGRRNITFRVADLESLDLPPESLHVVLSRWGLMCASDHLATFRSLAGMLRPGGILAAAVWGDAIAAPMISLGYRVISRELELAPPPPGLPGPFSMADRERLVRDLVQAGFVDVSVSQMVVTFEVDSIADFVSFTLAVTPPPLRRLLAALPDRQDEEVVWSAVAEAAEAFRTDGVLRLPSSTWCLRAVAPPDSRSSRRAHG